MMRPSNSSVIDHLSWCQSPSFSRATCFAVSLIGRAFSAEERSERWAVAVLVMLLVPTSGFSGASLKSAEPTREGVTAHGAGGCRGAGHSERHETLLGVNQESLSGEMLGPV